MEITWTESERLRNWKLRVTGDSSREAEFEKWLFVSIASVIFGRKAGELLSLTSNQFDLPLAQRLACVAQLVESWDLSSYVLYQTTFATQVIIYRAEQVQEALTAVSPCILACTLNYVCGLDPAAFLAEVARRWQETGDIPHEIGLALGYPIKDVLGYMGVLPLPCTCCCGWRVYGDPAPSLDRSRAFVAARQQALFFLHAPGVPASAR